MMVLPERRDAPRPHHTICEARKESRMARVAFLVPLRCGFAQTRRVARAEQVTDRVVSCSRQAEHGCPVSAQPAVHSTARCSREARFLPPRCLCARAPTAQMTLSQSGLLTERPRRTREFTARTCPSRRPARIRAPAGLRASGIRATGAAIQRQRRLKSWAQPHSRRNTAGQSHAHDAVAATPMPGRPRSKTLERSPSSGQPHYQEQQTHSPRWCAA